MESATCGGGKLRVWRSPLPSSSQSGTPSAKLIDERVHPSDSIQCLAFDHKLLAYGTSSGLIYVMHVRENRPNDKEKEKERSLVEYAKLNAASVGKTKELSDLNGVTCLGFSSGARYLSAGHGNGRILIWDLKTGTVIKEFHLVDNAEAEEANPDKGQSKTLYSNPIVSLVFSPSDSYIAVTLEMKSVVRDEQPSKTSCVYLFSVVSQRLVGKFHTRGSGTIRHIKFSPLKRSWLAAVNDDGDVYVWDINIKPPSIRRVSPAAAGDTPNSTSSTILSLFHFMKSPATGLSFYTANSSHILIVASTDGSIYFIDLNIKKVVRHLEINKAITSVDVISNSMLLTTDQGKIMVYSSIESLMNTTNHGAKENQESSNSATLSVTLWLGHSSPITAACFRPSVASTSSSPELSTPKATSKSSTSSRATDSKDGTPMKQGESGPREMARTPIKTSGAKSTKESRKSLDEDLFSPLEDINQPKETANAPQYAAATAAAAPLPPAPIPVKPEVLEGAKKKEQEKKSDSLASDVKPARDRTSNESRKQMNVPLIRSLNAELNREMVGGERPQVLPSSSAQPSVVDQKHRPMQPEAPNLRPISEAGPPEGASFIHPRNSDMSSQAITDKMSTSRLSAAESSSKEDKTNAMKSEVANTGRKLSAISSSSLSSTSPSYVLTTPLNANVEPNSANDLPNFAKEPRASISHQALDSSKPASPSDHNLTPNTMVSIEAQAVLSSEELAKVASVVQQIVRQELEAFREAICTSFKSMHLDLIRNSVGLESQMERLAEHQLQIDKRLAEMEYALQSTSTRRVFHM